MFIVKISTASFIHFPAWKSQFPLARSQCLLWLSQKIVASFSSDAQIRNGIWNLLQLSHCLLVFTCRVAHILVICCSLPLYLPLRGAPHVTKFNAFHLPQGNNKKNV